MQGEWFAPKTFWEIKTMTRFKTLAMAALTALTLGTTLSATSAEAGYWGRRGYGWGAGAGIVGAIAAGAIIAGATRPAYGYSGYYGGRSCEMVERINRYGEVVGYRRVCGYY